MIIKIGEKVKLLRKKNDVTQDRLAEYLGITAQAISRWESETCYPDIELLPAGPPAAEWRRRRPPSAFPDRSGVPSS